MHLEGGPEAWDFGLTTDPFSSVLPDSETSLLDLSHHELYVRVNRHGVEVVREPSLIVRPCQGIRAFAKQLPLL